MGGYAIEIDGQTIYLRRYRLLVGTGGGMGIDMTGLRIMFAIEKSMAETPNSAEISLYNLSPKTENTIIKSGQRVTLEAGYEGDQYGLIYDGDIIQALRGKEDSTTYKLTLICQDGDMFINDGFVNKTYSKGQSPSTITRLVTTTAKNGIEVGGISENLEDRKLARGKTVFGLARDTLRDIAKTEQATFYVDDRKVHIVKAKDLPKGRIIDLTPQTGLIGAIEQQDDGVKGKCLLNPLLKLNSFVHIDNSTVREAKRQRDSEIKQLDQDGVYRLIKLTFTGDTRAQSPWYTDFVGISQVSALPDTGNSMR